MLRNSHSCDSPDDLAPEALEITIGPDGRLFFHDLTAEILPAACALCPQDPEISQRMDALASLKECPHDDLADNPHPRRAGP